MDDAGFHRVQEAYENESSERDGQLGSNDKTKNIRDGFILEV